MTLNTPNLLMQFYLDKYSNMPFLDLIKELNHIDNPNKITKCLIISTRIVFHISQLIGGNGFKNNLDLQTSTAMSLVLRRLKDDTPLKFEEIENIVRTEINFVSNMLFRSNSLNTVDLEGYYQDEGLNEVFLEELKKELIAYVPSHLRLSMYNFLKTSIISIDNYSDIDRYIFYLSLEQNGYEVDMEAKNYYLELETMTEKAVFLQLLMRDYPTIFILFTSLKSMNHLVMLSKYETLGLPSTLKLLGIFEDLANKTKELVKTGNYDVKTAPKSIQMLSKSLVQDEEIDMLELMKKSLDKLYDSFDRVTDGVTRLAENRSNLPIIANQLNKEVIASTNLISNVQKIYAKHSK